MELTWRPLTVADTEVWAALLAAAERVDDTGAHYDSADLVEELADPELAADRDTLAVWAGGELVGYGLTRGVTGVLDGRYRVFCEGTVAPAWRRRGLGRQIMDWTLERAAGLVAERHPAAVGEVQLELVPGNLGQRALAGKYGFAPLRYYFGMLRDLPGPKLPVDVPAGLRLAGYDPAYDEAIRNAHNEAFADHWGFTPPSREKWRYWTGQRAFRPEVSFLLLHDGAATGPADPVAAYLLTGEYEADTAASGVRQAYINLLGTRRAWRGRGAGRALLCRALTAFAEAGFQRAALHVDAANPTGALGLYERVGFTVEREWARLARGLPLA